MDGDEIGPEGVEAPAETSWNMRPRAYIEMPGGNSVMMAKAMALRPRVFSSKPEFSRYSGNGAGAAAVVETAS